MKKQKLFFILSWGAVFSIVFWVVMFSLLLPTTAHADNCLDDIFNLADCLRTPVIREAITFFAAGLGMTPVALGSFLASLGAQNPIPSLLQDLFRNIEKGNNPLNDLYNGIKSAFEQIIKGVKSQAIRSAGESLAENSADIIDSLDKSSSGDSDSSSTGDQSGGSGSGSGTGSEAQSGSGAGGAGTKSGSSSSGAGTGSGSGSGAGGTGGHVKTGVPVTVPVTGGNIQIFDSGDAFDILEALNLIPPGTPPNGQINVTWPDLDKILGSHPSGNPIQVTLDNGKTVIITKVEGIAFDSGGPGTGGNPGVIDFSKGIAIAAEVVEEDPTAGAPAPTPSPTPSGSTPSGSGTPTGQQPGGQQQPTGQTPPGGDQPQTPPDQPQTPPDQPQTPPDQPQTPPDQPQTPPDQPQEPGSQPGEEPDINILGESANQPPDQQTGEPVKIPQDDGSGDSGGNPSLEDILNERGADSGGEQGPVNNNRTVEDIDRDIDDLFDKIERSNTTDQSGQTPPKTESSDNASIIDDQESGSATDGF